jgi:hypothetical protein
MILRPLVITLAGCGIALAATGCSALATSSTAPPAAATTAAARPSAAPAKARPAATVKADPSAACYKRPNATGDILVRMLVPTLGWQAQRLGGEWTWNVTARQCMTSVQMIIAGAPTEAGNCTQVALAASNPGYDENATPAAPLKKVIAEAGPGC